MAFVPLPTPTLHTARLRLRPFDDPDANDLFALHSNKHVLRYWDAPPWNEPERAKRFITACRHMAEEGTGARTAVERTDDGVFIGWCSLSRWDPPKCVAGLLLRHHSVGQRLRDRGRSRAAAVGLRDPRPESRRGRDRYAQPGICTRPREARLRA